MYRQRLAIVALAALLPSALLPSALGAVLYAADVPDSVHQKVANGSCVLPDDFVILDLGGTSANASSFGSLDFVFYDNSTLLMTPCHLNASSAPVEIPGRSDRWACDHAAVEFLFDNSTGILTMLERVCPGTDGKDIYETAGAVGPILPRCSGALRPSEGGGLICVSAQGSVTVGKFSSVNPVPPVEK